MVLLKILTAFLSPTSAQLVPGEKHCWVLLWICGNWVDLERSGVASITSWLLNCPKQPSLACNFWGSCCSPKSDFFFTSNPPWLLMSLLPSLPSPNHIIALYCFNTPICETAPFSQLLGYFPCSFAIEILRDCAFCTIADLCLRRLAVLGEWEVSCLYPRMMILKRGFLVPVGLHVGMWKWCQKPIWSKYMYSQVWGEKCWFWYWTLQSALCSNLSGASWLKSSNIFELCMEAAVVLQREGKADMYWHAWSRLYSTE